MKVTLTIEANSLDEITTLLSGGKATSAPEEQTADKTPTPETPGEEDAPKEEVKEEKKPATRSRAKAATKKEETPEEEPAKEEKAVEADNSEDLTIEEVRAQIAAKIAANAKFREPVKALVTKYEAKNVSALLPEHFDNFLTDLNALK